MVTQSTLAKDSAASGDRDKILTNEMRVAKSVALAQRLPLFITINTFWASICLCVVAHYRSWPVIPTALMLVLMTVVWAKYKSPSVFSESNKPAKKGDHSMVVYFFAIGALWCIGILKYLPSLPLDMRLFLGIGCLLLVFGASFMTTPMPSVSIVYSTPIFIALTVLGCSTDPNISTLVVILAFLAASTLALIMFENWKDFLKSSKLAVERNQFSVSSKSAVVLRNQFLENMSHEIKTPLTAILGYTRLLTVHKSDVQTGREEILEHLEASTVSLIRTTDILLDAAKLNSGQLALNDKSFDLKLILSKILEVFKIASRKKIFNLKSISAEISRNQPQEILNALSKSSTVFLKMR